MIFEPCCFFKQIPRPADTPFERGNELLPPLKGGAEEQPVPIFFREGGGFSHSSGNTFSNID